MLKITLIFKKLAHVNSAWSARFVVKNIKDESTKANDSSHIL